MVGAGRLARQRLSPAARPGRPPALHPAALRDPARTGRGEAGTPRPPLARARPAFPPPPPPGRARAFDARGALDRPGLTTIRNIDQAVEPLPGGQRQGVAIARTASFGSKGIVMDEPTAALGVGESRRVLDPVSDVARRGPSVVPIGHDMPHVFELADRIHIQRLGRRIAVVRPQECSMSNAVAIMTGAMPPPGQAAA